MQLCKWCNRSEVHTTNARVVPWITIACIRGNTGRGEEDVTTLSTTGKAVGRKEIVGSSIVLSRVAAFRLDTRHRRLICFSMKQSGPHKFAADFDIGKDSLEPICHISGASTGILIAGLRYELSLSITPDFSVLHRYRLLSHSNFCSLLNLAGVSPNKTQSGRNSIGQRHVFG